MNIKRAATLVCTFEDAQLVVHNFLTKQMFECSAMALEVLAHLDEWVGAEDALAALPGNVDDNVALLGELIRQDLVLVEGSPQAERDQQYRDNWRWGSVAGFYHFSLRDLEFLDADEKLARLRQYKEESSSPPLLTSNAGMAEVHDLPPIDLEEPFFASLYKRRSARDYSPEPISKADLAACLFAGNGLKEILDAGEYGRLPLTMTPSGGGRNPFELYVWARNVLELTPGFYHYSAAEHSLGYIGNGEHQPADLLGNQAWTNAAAAVIFFCATFERSAWKYRQALAYRVILMEVGAITQNLQLTAAHRGLAAAPTGALAESKIEQQLGLKEIEQGVMFAVALGNPA